MHGHRRAAHTATGFPQRTTLSRRSATLRSPSPRKDSTEFTPKASPSSSNSKSEYRRSSSITLPLLLPRPHRPRRRIHRKRGTGRCGSQLTMDMANMRQKRSDILMAGWRCTARVLEGHVPLLSKKMWWRAGQRARELPGRQHSRERRRHEVRGGGLWCAETVGKKRAVTHGALGSELR